MQDYNLQDDQLRRNRLVRSLALVLGFVFLVLIFRLGYLQISLYEYHHRLSDNNRLRLKIKEAPRGLILDRKGRVLAQSRPSFHICIVWQDLVNAQSVRNNLLQIRNTDSSRVFDSTIIDETLLRARWRPFTPLSILDDASTGVVALIEERQLDLPGIVVLPELRREYPNGKLAAHALGYTSEIAENELETMQKQGYRLGNRIGIKGLEKVYESSLRGQEGKEFIEVNVHGRQIRKLAEMPNQEAISGSTLITTLDLDLQKVAQEAFSDSLSGALVALDPRNGDVYAILSSPGIDFNFFSLSREQRARAWQTVAFDKRRPLNDRSLIGLYEPASTFKTVVSLAGFLKGRIGPNYRGYRGCGGGYQFGRRYQKCWDPKGHGILDFFGAYRQSCDTYYYQLGLTLDMDPINSMARLLGLGERTGIDLAHERSGLLMDSLEYTRKFSRRGWRWSRGQILNLAIGQGQLVTPIQLAVMIASVAEGKHRYRPRLVSEIRDHIHNQVYKQKPIVNQELHIPDSVTLWMRQAMRQVVGPGGTGGRAGFLGVDIGGKTGSAENPHGKLTHALFVGVAPLEKPEIALAVVVENAGHGGSVAAPIAGKIFEAFFKMRPNGNAR